MGFNADVFAARDYSNNTNPNYDAYERFPLANNGYLDDPKFEYNALPSNQKNYTPKPFVDGAQVSLTTTKYALGLFVLSFVIFFTLGISNSIFWVVSMIVGILAHIVALKGIADAKSSTTSILTAVLTGIPAYLSCCFLFIALVAQINRMS